MKLNDKLETLKRNLAGNLSQATEGYSAKTKKRTLLLTGFACALLCIWLSALPFISKRTTTRANVSMPVVIHPLQNEPILSKEEYKLLEGFITTMDSLKQVNREAYQNAMTGREGLIDSILFLLRHSEQQLTK